MSDYNARRTLYQTLAERRGSKVLAYVTGDRPGLETQISSEVLDMFIEHLDAIGVTDKITLILYTRGGDPLTAWTVVNLINQFCKELEIIVPSKAHSAGTLLALGSKHLVMTKQATLGPIDPSINSPLGPQIPGAQPLAKAPVSVEAVQGYLDLMKSHLPFWRRGGMAQILHFLSDKVHPLVLGQVTRSRAQTRYLANRLLSQQNIPRRRVKKIVNFLSGESGSHDYTINRREARALGLSVETPSQDFYEEIRDVMVSYKVELQLSDPFNPNALVATTNTFTYKLVRCLIESEAFGSHQFLSEGTLTKSAIQLPTGIQQFQITDQRQFEGWRKI